MGDALNNRLGTKNLSFADLINESAKRDMSLGHVMAMPELSEYKYDSGSLYVCSGLATAILQQAGVFGDLAIDAHEQTPRDVFQFKIYDEDYESALPKECLENDPGLPYCQIMGDILVEHNIPNREFNSIEPYSGMNEHCSGFAPNYQRPEGC